MPRPRKYSTKKLREKVDAYFDSITRDVTITEQIPTGELDAKGHMIYETMPVWNKLGQPATAEEYIIPPTVGGLCEYLGIHRSTWAEYCDISKYPEYSDTISRARGRMLSYLEKQLLTRPGKDVRGIIFNMQNNYGYIGEKCYLDLGPGAQNALKGVTMTERAAMLRNLLDDVKQGDFDYLHETGSGTSTE